MDNNNNNSPKHYDLVSHARPASYSKASSASCANAKPNEDWTKMTDLAERRRVQNRIAQRNYRQKLKQRLERGAELERRAVSTSPPSTTALLVSSPETQDRSSSTGTAVNTNFMPQPPMPLFQELFPEQYASVHDNQFPAAIEGYMKQPMTPAPMPFSFPGHTQSIPASYTGFPQSTGYADLPSMSVPYSNPMHQGQYAVAQSPMTTASMVTPITPSSQEDCYPRPPYGMDFTPTYNNPQVPSTQPYTDSAASVNLSDFFPQHYPSS